MFKKPLLTLTVLLTMAVVPMAQAASDKACETVDFAKVNWTGLTIKTETAAWLLQQLGYKTNISSYSISFALYSLAQNDADVLLGLWIPSQREMASKFLKKGDIDIVTKNLSGGKYTVAVNQAAWDAGVRSFKDLAEHAARFDNKIFGIEAGNEGNGFIKAMIGDDAYGMHVFELVPSSEAGMLTAVKRRISKDEWAAWLGWAPHPMNIDIDMKYLTGGAKYFGPNQGAASVYTLARSGYAWNCRNVGQFLENYKFTADEQSLMSSFAINKDMKALDAGLELIKQKPELLERWLGHGGTYSSYPIKTFDGSDDGLEVVRKALAAQ